ncbi:class I SAM-dependent methyltransferase [Sphaerisporangium sp. B11E5]|uniref:class I SAM-dependent methyltransferase n=1 Tax=Sphaerisporangium sp. B11E5 TaxID=3153563 RepID=UPI00325C646D
MTDTSHLTVTAGAYDAIAVLYAEYVQGYLDRFPLDRAMLAAFAASVPPGPVADLGCGPGHITALLHGLGRDAFGVDLSPVTIDLARDAHPGLRFEVGSMHELPLPEGTLAGAVSWYSVIHTPPAELPRYFEEFQRVLAPGGFLLLAFFESEGGPVTAFDHRVTLAYRWPIDEVAALACRTGFVEVGRMLREPGEDERFRRGHLLMRKQ